MAISRQCARFPSLALKTSASGAGYTDIPFSDYAGGNVYIPAASSITTLTFYVAAVPPGGTTPATPGTGAGTPTYTQLYDKTNTAVSITVAAGRAYPLPAELFGVGVFQIVADAAGNVDLSLKA